MILPTRRTARPSAVARRIRPATICVGDGRISCTQFSISRSESNSKISCVPVPTSTQRICILCFGTILYHLQDPHGGPHRARADRWLASLPYGGQEFAVLKLNRARTG